MYILSLSERRQTNVTMLSLAHCWRKPLEIRFFFSHLIHVFGVCLFVFFFSCCSHELSISFVSVLFSLLLYFITFLLLMLMLLFLSLLMIYVFVYVCVDSIYFYLSSVAIIVFLFVYFPEHKDRFLCVCVSFIRHYYGWWFIQSNRHMNTFT